jgi:hypothetical protein
MVEWVLTKLLERRRAKRKVQDLLPDLPEYHEPEDAYGPRLEQA